MADAVTVVTSYNLFEFDFEEARLGALCAIVDSSDSYDLPKSVRIIDSTDRCVTPAVNYHGKGICRQANTGTLSIVVNSTEYFFNSQGKGVSSNSLLYKLLLLKLDSSIPRTGDLVTRGIGSSQQTDSIYVTGMSARDEFAKQALRGILMHIEDPFNLSDNEISYYCAAAYKWASSMMLSAANSRGTQNSSGSSAVEVQSLDSNVERLLNNIEAAIRSSNGSGGVSGTTKVANATGDNNAVIPLTIAGTTTVNLQNSNNPLYISIVSNS